MCKTIKINQNYHVWKGNTDMRGWQHLASQDESTHIVFNSLESFTQHKYTELDCDASHVNHTT